MPLFWSSDFFTLPCTTGSCPIPADRCIKKNKSVTYQGREKDKEKVTNDSSVNLFALSGWNWYMLSRHPYFQIWKPEGNNSPSNHFCSIWKWLQSSFLRNLLLKYNAEILDIPGEILSQLGSRSGGGSVSTGICKATNSSKKLSWIYYMRLFGVKVYHSDKKMYTDLW